MIASSVEAMRVTTIFKVMQRLYEYCECKQIAYQAIDNLSRFAEARKKFMEDYYSGTSEVLTYTFPNNYRPLS